jgi:hypothetical protein
MKSIRFIALAGLLIAIAIDCPAQTKLKLSAIKPGTEQVQLIPNGNFQLQGTHSGGNYPNPPGWNRTGDMFANIGSNTVPVNQSVIARGQMDSGAPASLYTQTIALEPATAYVLSAYLWNLGDAANHVNTVVDLNDASGEAQLLLSYSDSEADKGYFVYSTFNTSTTGTNLTLRVFYDGKAGTGTAPAYYPIAAQWDNIAITKSADFIAPAASNSTADIRPLVTITNPVHGSTVSVSTPGPGLTVSADASDLDGSVMDVTFFAGTNQIGQANTSPWSISWSGVTSSNYVLLALATDNNGNGAWSPPVSVTVSLVAVPPTLAPLNISLVGSNVVLSWPTNSVPMSIQSNADLLATAAWERLTNPIVVVNDQNTLTVPASGAQMFFRGTSEVDPTTLNHKLMMGYQGWFACPGDGSVNNAWVHWFRNNTPTAANLTADMWPDMSELDADELFATSLTYSNGATAKLYSAYQQKTVMRHFKWMQDNHLDGVFFQRFLADLSGNIGLLRNQVALNVKAGAEAYGRTFAIMYDISGYPTNTLVSALTNDWTYLVNTQGVTNSPVYLRHKGKPVVAIWGVGFSGRSDTPAQCIQTVNWFKSVGCTVMGGVPSYWRTLINDSQTDPAWTDAFRSFDIISPWAVGRYSDNAGADVYRLSVTVPDLADCTAHGIDYMPVVFPGFTWHNLNGGPSNQIPRNGGDFYWHQVYNDVLSGCSMMYGAMFDEVDEGTAMFKIAPTPVDQPPNCNFVPLNVDGYNLPSDWYLRLANEAGKMLRGDTPLQSTIPISP